MGSGQLPRADPPPQSSEEPRSRLDSWKEIASYLGRSEKTVRRWEETEGLPVHRLQHEKRASVYAYTSELEQWRQTRKTAVDCEPASADDGAQFSNEAPPAQLEPTDKATSRDDKRWRPRLIAVVIAVISSFGLLAGVYWARLRPLFTPGPSLVPIQSLVVLPFHSISSDTEQEYFADGMTAELITELAKIRSLRVISETSAMLYKRTRKPLQQIARELQVDAVLEGEVLRSEHRVRITAQLIQTATDEHLWAETYERDLRDVVELQGEIAQSIADTIRTNVTAAGHIPPGSWRRISPEAYDAYLKGRFFWNKRTESGLKKSIEYFQEAIQKDPGYALAYSGLADSYGLLAGYRFLPTQDTYSKAKVAANQALELDNTLGEAHTVLGDILYRMDWDWPGAEKEYKRAIELNPSYATAHQRYSLFLMEVGRRQESLAEIYRALALDPLSLSVNSSVGWRLLWARRYDEAIEQLQKTLEMEPRFSWTHKYLGWAYEAKGDSEKAIDEFQKMALSDTSSDALALLGHAYACGGHTQQARDVLQQLEERSKRGYVPGYPRAVVYAGLGEKDRAFGWLEKSCRHRDTELVSLKADLELDNLRSDPRFDDLLRCVGLQQ